MGGEVKREIAKRDIQLKLLKELIEKGKNLIWSRAMDADEIEMRQMTLKEKDESYL